MAQLISSRQVAENAILDEFNRQAYLGNQFVAGTALVTLSNTNETPLIYLANAATNNVSLFNAVKKFNNADSTNLVTFRFYINPTGVSGGTVKTPINCRPASSYVSVATCLISPTTATNGTLAATFPIAYSYFQNTSDVLFIADPGQSLLITAQAVSGTPEVAAEYIWWEM